MEEFESKIKELFGAMRDWERRPLLSVGSVVVELLKLPRRELKRGVEPEKLVIHIRLQDSFKGIFIEDSKELEDLKLAINRESVEKIARALDEVNRRQVVEYGI